MQEAGRLPWKLEDLETVAAWADEELQRAAAAAWEMLAPAIDAVRRADIETLRTDLRGWLREVALEDASWVPVAAEFAFGQEGSGTNPAGSEVRLDSFQLRSRIDWVETRHRELRVTDHKTGRPLSEQERPVTLGRGEILQPALYALAAQELFQKHAASGRLFFCTQRGNHQITPITISPRVRKRAVQLLATIDRAIEQGQLPAAPRAGACKSCPYHAVCGPGEERRTQRKVPQRALQEIRSWV